MLKNFIIGIIFLFMPWMLQAQFQLTGKVSNQKDGKALPGANIVIGNSFLATTSDLNGNFTFKNLKPGTYQIKISYVGFETYKEKINVKKDTHLNVLLKSTSYMSDEVIISATRVNANSPNTFENFSSTKLDKENLGKDLPYLLKMTPSLVVTSDAGTGVGYTGLHIRGVSLSEINVTLNGVPVNDAEDQSVYFVDLPDLASSIDNIQIQRGVGTSSNGAAAFGASINIKTGIFNANPYAEIVSSAGSFNTFKNTVSFGTGLLKKHWVMSGRFSDISSDGYIDRATSKLRSGYFSAGYYSKHNIFKAIVLMGHEKTYQAWYGVPKDSLATNPTYNPAGIINGPGGNFLGYYPNQTDNYTQNYYQLHYAHQFNSNLNLAAAVFLTRGFGYYESYDNSQNPVSYGLNDTIIGNTVISKTSLIEQKWLSNYFYGSNFSMNYKKGASRLSVGGGWSRFDGDHYGKVVWAQVATLGEYDRNWYFNKGLKTDFNIFAKWNYQLSNKFNLMADLQYRGINYWMHGTLNNLTTLDHHPIFNFLNPKAGVFYKMNSHNSVYFSFAISHRDPNRSVYRDADPGQVIKREKLMDYELGYKLQLQKFSFDATMYYMNYVDQLVLTGKINDVGTAIMTNVPSSYRAGIELVAGWQLARTLRWNLNATFSQNKIKNFTEYTDNWNYYDDPSTQPYQYSKYLGTTNISFSPDVIAGSSLVATPVKNLEMTWDSKYVGRQYLDNTSTKERSLNPYWINNLRFDYTFHPSFVKQLNLMLSLNNIFNVAYQSNAWVYTYIYGGQQYEMNGYYPQARFNFMAGVDLKF